MVITNVQANKIQVLSKHSEVETINPKELRNKDILTTSRLFRVKKSMTTTKFVKK